MIIHQAKDIINFTQIKSSSHPLHLITERILYILQFYFREYPLYNSNKFRSLSFAPIFIFFFIAVMAKYFHYFHVNELVR